ncbi:MULTISPECIES: SpoIIE family protein phosphatase [unclassified Streptomyces]|uniref:SpoIIE family protein phosphatase n=1 Tax=unclassified Streptomyces TaxID=2593676 RepID=UPI00210BAB2F|nr:SpoIIE family protein phosphatase [Streptomyces sp. DvalAA-14]
MRRVDVDVDADGNGDGNGDGAGAGQGAALLDRLLERIGQAVGAHIGATFLLVPEQQVLLMTTVTGAPRRLALPWARLALAAPGPLPETVRTLSPVWVSDQEAAARRFPRIALAFPYSIAMYNVPLVVDGAAWGVLVLMWPESRPELTAAERARVGDAADAMAGVLREAAARGRPIRPRDEPLVLEPPPTLLEPAAALLERLTEGFVALDLCARMTFITGRAARLLGRDPDELLGAEPWDALPWLNDPAFENAFVAVLFSRRPAGFAARRPDGAWLSFAFYADATGVSMRVKTADAPDSAPRAAEDAPPATPARAGTLFHLLHLASALTEATSVSEVAESLMAQMRPVLNATGLALLVSDEGRLGVVGERGFPPEMREHFDGLPLANRTEGIRTIRTGVPGFHSTNAALVRSYPQHRHYREMDAFAFLPLTVSNDTFGCLVLGYDRPRDFSPDERAELTSLAGMIAQALERARLYDANADVARGLQDGLLPRHLPRVPGLEVAARYLPATHTQEVGGDFYDLIDFGSHAAAAVIGDVQGHSVQAAALMGQIRTAVHSHARTGAPPEEVLARTNQALLELKSDLFCSCLYAHIDLPGHRVLLASAGHPPPILRRPDHRAEVLDLPPGLLLGVAEGARFETVEVPLPPGSLLALYTDGLVERPGIDLGSSVDLLAGRLAAAADGPVEQLADRIIAQAQETVVPRSSDDIALLLVARGIPGPAT